MSTTPERSIHGPDGLKATLYVGLGALVLFAPTVFLFNVQTTDLSAIRVLGGEVLYRDVWTMYAPGSIYVMALAYAVFGVHMIVGNLLGVLVSAAAVAALFRFAARAVGRRAAAVVASGFAFAFLAAGYQNSLASYPPAILLVFLALDRLAAHAESERASDLVTSGVLLGAAGLFKHDVAAYACVAAAVGLSTTAVGSAPRAARSIAWLGLVVAAVMAVPLALFVRAGAGPAMIQDFLVFPRTYFPVVRPEGFRILPPRTTDLQALWWWFDVNAPSWAWLAGLPGVARVWARATPSARRVVVMSGVIFVMFWLAAHVQANTHRISMAGFGALICVAGLLGYGGVPRGSRRVGEWVSRVAVVWCCVMLAPWIGRYADGGIGTEPIRLPRLEWILAPTWQAEQLRELAQALDEAGPPDAPLLQVGWRNDVLIYAGATPYWASSRRMVTPYQELHPGITDVEPGQRRMVADLSLGPEPVVVREHRFQAAALEEWGERYRAGGVPVGATLLDEWVDARYESWRRIGPYEVMRLRP